MNFVRMAVAGAALLVGFSVAAQADTLDTIKARGKLVCGVNTGLAGFGSPNDQGQWSGLDIDLCKAVAAAVFGDANKVDYKPLNETEMERELDRADR